MTPEVWRLDGPAEMFDVIPVSETNTLKGGAQKNSYKWAERSPINKVISKAIYGGYITGRGPPCKGFTN